MQEGLGTYDVYALHEQHGVHVKRRNNLHGLAVGREDGFGVSKHHPDGVKSDGEEVPEQCGRRRDNPVARSLN